MLKELDTSKLKNLQAYTENFNIKLYFYIDNKTIYATCENLQNHSEIDFSYIQSGTLDYIDGWLYGAVQCNCRMFNNQSKKIVVISKKYYDINGHLKYRFNVFNSIKDCINQNYTDFRKTKNGLTTFKDNFRNAFNNREFDIIDLTNIQ